MLKSFRMRLVVAFVALFAAISVAVSFAGLMLRESQIRSVFDRELHTRASDFLSTLRRQRTVSADTVRQVVSDLSGQIYFRDFFIEAWDEKGQRIARSGNLQSYDLPSTSATTQSDDEGDIIVERAPPGLLPPNEQSGLRGVQLRVGGNDEHTYVISIMTSPMFTAEAVSSLRWLFFGGNMGGLLAACGAAWLVTGAMSRRLSAIKEQVQRVGPDHLDQRIDSQEDDEIGQLAGYMNAMLDRLKAGFETQERFIHDASHELKTPIATVQAEAQAIMLGDHTEEELLNFVHSTNDEMRRMGRLAESLLLLTRNNEAHMVRRFQPAELSEITTSALRHLATLAKDHQVKLHLQYDLSDEAAVIQCDADLLEAMISNLARNAIRFSPRDHEVLIKLGHDTAAATITVEDEGPGIPQDVLPHIFDRFFQSSPKKIRRGAGVGLAIASTVATLHGGTIVASNKPEKGARFTVRLPLSSVPSPAHAAQIK